MTNVSNKERRHGIDYEIIVDCYDEYEQSMGWIIYLIENLKTPFKARYLRFAHFKTSSGNLRKRHRSPVVYFPKTIGFQYVIMKPMIFNPAPDEWGPQPVRRLIA